ncbi:uncharacterized protein BDZ99DRAFT_568444 [Mytilinidion resinicola]|uniref:Uncharacterized protein n=1 Tax=Mytilinidion resinicola TaxID=574789 RepID=A0A6A6YW69_9PEZI|nr:uncharacterized protein BDZ99DRAFT_568444 [Mytilinidion resinicola]KAF2813206.1 hypothetical protein BDZ99DRAFT_568444 [Mytilinidion resinicola]
MPRGAKIPRQGAVQSVADDEIALMAKPYQPSLLESLPAEIRQRIYFHLGVIINRKAWYTCTDPHCNYPSHYRTPIASDDCGGRGWDHPNHYQTSFLGCQVKKYNFNYYSLRRPEVDAICDTNKQPRPSGNLDRHAVYLGLLRASKFFYADIQTLAYTNIPVEFGFQLSNRAIHLNNWESLLTKDSFSWIPQPKWEHVGLSPFSFRFMTSIVLDSQLGHTYEAEMPHSRPTSDRKTGALLTKQAMSVRYIARHCPALRKLEVRPFVEFFVRGKLSNIDTMAFAMQELVHGCAQLEEIVIAYIETRRVSLGDYPELGEDEKYSDSFFTNLLFEEDAWFSASNVNDCLNLRNIPKHLREGQAQDWAKGTLAKIRKHNRRIPDVAPLGPYGSGLWAETYSTAGTGFFWSGWVGWILSNDAGTRYKPRACL